MQNAAKRKSLSPVSLAALRVLLLLVVTLCLGQTRVWGFGITAPPASGVFESVTPSSTGENTIASGYDASDSPLARVIPYAQSTGARTIPFGATAEKWSAMTRQQQYKLNDGGLRARINEGDSFKYIGEDPLRPDAVRKSFDLTGSELLRLDDRTIPYQIVDPVNVYEVVGNPMEVLKTR